VTVQACVVQVCVPGRLHTCDSGPLQVCGEVGQVWNVPLQVSGRELPQVPKLHTATVAPVQAPAPPEQADGAKLLQVPTVRLLQTGAL
jgi:hypothetical protein